MKNLIVTYSDARYGEFLINHWLRSLKENVDINNADIAVLDYGLTDNQISRLKKENIIVHKGVRDGHVNCVRFRDLAKFLENRKYSQILSTDGGDVIFQAGLDEVFNKDKDYFRAVCEEFGILNRTLKLQKNFRAEHKDKVFNFLSGKKQINAGVIFAPYGKFKKLCKECYSMIDDNPEFGLDQLAVNYIMHRDGFKELDEKYNFIITTSKNDFFIKNGVFYLKNGEKIPIIHNAGNKKILRPIKDFGYGADHNEVKPVHFILRTISKTFSKII